jgi:hypothetical protein
MMDCDEHLGLAEPQQLKPFYQPSLAPSVTNDEDDDDDDDDDDNDMDDPHAALVHEVRNGSVAGSDRAALAYLLKYETMVRQQEAEDMAVMDHIRPCMERLNELAAGTCNNNNDSTTTKTTVNRWSSTTQVLSQEISYAAMATALQRLESTATDSNDNNKDVSSVEFMTTDRQLMMVLRLLTRSTLTGTDNHSPTITWAEFLQCYKTCIVGMMTLQHLAPQSAARHRARDRTLRMLGLFSAPANQQSATTTNGTTIKSDPSSQDVASKGAWNVRRPGGDAFQAVSLPIRRKKARRTTVIVTAAVVVVALVTLALVESRTSVWTSPPASSVEFPEERAAAATGTTLSEPKVVSSNSGRSSGSRSSSATTSSSQTAPSLLHQLPATFARQHFFASPARSVAAAFAVPPQQAPTNQDFVSYSMPEQYHPVTESVTAPAVLGGVVGMLGAPVLYKGLQQGLLAISTATTVAALVPTVLAAVGAVTAATVLVRGLWSLWERVNHRHFGK